MSSGTSTSFPAAPARARQPDSVRQSTLRKRDIDDADAGGGLIRVVQTRSGVGGSEVASLEQVDVERAEESLRHAEHVLGPRVGSTIPAADRPLPPILRKQRPAGDRG
jgi:hypothetical protein